MLLLESLCLKDFRNYQNREFLFDNKDILFCGSNGSGKTSILEAINYLSILRSFRTKRFKEIVSLGKNRFELEAKINFGEYSKSLKIIQNSSRERKVFIDRNNISKPKDFIKQFLTVIFVPEDAQIIGGSAAFRRVFFDMLISKLDDNYLDCLAKYRRALEQRNSALKSNVNHYIIDAFDQIMAENIGYICLKRLEYSKELEVILNEKSNEYKGGGFKIEYSPLYPTDKAMFLEQLKLNFSKDKLRGVSSFGPHLDDFGFFLDGKELRKFGSTGQIRLASLLLKLAELSLLKKTMTLTNAGAKRIVLLIDDVTGELDRNNMELFFHQIKDSEQRFFTFTETPKVKLCEEYQRIEL